MTHVYFVSYQIKGGYAGNMEVKLSRPISTMKQIEDLQRWMAREESVNHYSYNAVEVTILNYQLLRTE